LCGSRKSGGTADVMPIWNGENMFELKNGHFNAGLIARSGQCFRWNEEEDADGGTVWSVTAFDRVLKLKETGCDAGKERVNVITLDCSPDEYAGLWRGYFDMDTDYDAMDEAAGRYGDDFLTASLEDCRGMRILRQDRWETVISFLISQNNNIPRIRKSIERICGGRPHFPTPQEILDMDLSDKGLGYRDVYLKSAAVWWLEGRTELLEIKGVGPKVEACIRLYGMHELEYCPIDTWMKKLIAEDYNGVRPEWMDDRYAGYYQQLCFYHKRMAAGRK
jgi:N-glycosylase/DNA lyase